jgi:hypothetical protein
MLDDKAPGNAEQARWGEGRCARRRIALMVLVALLGPSAAEPDIGSGLPWPPYFGHARPDDLAVAAATWAAAALGGVGAGSGTWKR